MSPWAMLLGAVVGVAPVSTSTSTSTSTDDGVGPLEPIGVLRVARGAVRVGGRAGAAPGADARLWRPGERVEVADGWAELLVGAHLRLRLSAETVVEGPDAGRLMLQRGRVWLELGGHAPEALVVATPEGALRLHPGTSAVLERSGASSVAVRSGRVELPSGASVVAGRVGTLSGPSNTPEVEVGGGETFALVRREARAGLGDLSGWRALLLDGTARRRVEPIPVPGIEAQLDPHGLRSGGGPIDLLLEEASRPPAFFPEEVIPPDPP